MTAPTRRRWSMLWLIPIYAALLIGPYMMGVLLLGPPFPFDLAGVVMEWVFGVGALLVLGMLLYVMALIWSAWRDR